MLFCRYQLKTGCGSSGRLKIFTIPESPDTTTQDSTALQQGDCSLLNMPAMMHLWEPCTDLHTQHAHTAQMAHSLGATFYTSSALRPPSQFQMQLDRKKQVVLEHAPPKVMLQLLQLNVKDGSSLDSSIAFDITRAFLLHLHGEVHAPRAAQQAETHHAECA